MFKRKLDILMILVSIAISIISLFYLPESIPANYDQVGNITRYSTKYELALLFPIVMISIYLVISFMEYTLLAIHLRFITEFFKTFSVLIFSFENIKKILKIFNVNIPWYILIILWIVVIFISYELNFKKNISWFFLKKLTGDK